MPQQLKIINFFGQPLKNFELEILDTSNLFEGYEKVFYSKKFKDNKKKELKIKTPKGYYILRIKKRKRVFEKLMSKKDKEIRLPLKFSFLFNYEMPLSEKYKIAEKYRWDREKCYKCKKKYKDYLDMYECGYCGKFFCLKHHLPEDHNCKNPKKSEEYKKGAGGRIIWSKGKSRYEAN